MATRAENEEKRVGCFTSEGKKGKRDFGRKYFCYKARSVVCDPHLPGSCEVSVRCGTVCLMSASNPIVFIAERMGSKNARSGALTDVIRGIGLPGSGLTSTIDNPSLLPQYRQICPDT